MAFCFKVSVRTSCRRLLFFTVVWVMFLLFHGAHSYGADQDTVAKDNIRVVYINSYQSGYYWSDAIQNGVVSLLTNRYGSRLFLDIEYLHGKHYSRELSRKLGESILDSWKIKYPAGSVQLLLVSDQDAYDMVKRAKLKRGLFENVPMVFASVEDPGKLPPQSVGVLAAVDIRSNIELILKVMPETRRIWCVTDSSTTGRINSRRIQKLAASYFNKIDISFFNNGFDISEEELIKRAGQISYPEVILFINHATGGGKVVNILKFIEKLSASANVPVFGFVDQYLEYGVTGGNMFSGELIGHQMAQAGIAILSGTSVNLIPPMHEQTRPMFNYEKLKKFRINTSLLPENSVVINRPLRLWEDYGLYIIAVAIFIVLQSYLVLYLLFLIRQQRKLREESKDAVDRFKTLFDMAPIPMILSLGDGLQVTVNKKFTKVIGYEREDIPTIDRWWACAYPDPEYRSQVRKRWSEIIDHASSTEKELRQGAFEITCKNGTKKTMLVVASTYRSEIIVCFIDLSERIKSEQELKRINTLLSAQQESSIDGILLVDENGKILFFNRRFCKVWEIPDKVMLSGYDDEPLKVATRSVADPKAFLDKVEFLYKHKELRSQDEVPLRDGRILERYSTPLLAEDGTYYGRLWFFRDITERKQAELERLELQEQLTHAQKLESVGRLAGGVAHDFNNMLGVILGYTDLVMNNIDSANPLQAKLVEVKHAAERSAALTRQLLAFARKQTVNPKTFDLNSTVSSMLKMLKRLIGENIYLTWSPSIEEVVVRMDPSQLDQILANLCVNSRDAISETGQIRIKTYISVVPDMEDSIHKEMKDGKYSVLEVSDNGRGMDSELQEHVFEPFYTTKEVGQGTGLGLATVYGIVRQNSGFIQVISEPKKGATFRIYFPFQDLSDTNELEEREKTVLKSGFETVLLVEDEPMLLAINKEFLLDMGYNVVSAENPRGALRLAEQYNGKIDLLLTDVVMPNMNGRQLADNLMKFYPDLKVLFMSGYTANIMMDQGINEGEINFIKKPFSCSELADKLREILETENS